MSNLEKDSAAGQTSPASSTVQNGQGDKEIVEETAVQEAAALDKMTDELEYPTGMKLAVITIALALSVFLVALVCLIPLAHVWKTPSAVRMCIADALLTDRTTRSSRLPSPV